MSFYSSILNQLPELQALTCSSYKQSPGLPRWLSGKESACRCRRHGFDPWSRKVPHAAEQLSPWATSTEPVL